MEVRDRRDDADRADDRKGRRDDAVRRAGHHVAAACRDLIDGGGDFDLVLAQSQDFGRSKPIAGHRSPGAFDPDNGFVRSGPRGDQHGVDFRAETLDRAGAHVALEREHIDAFARLLATARLDRGLGLLLACPRQRLALLFVEQRAVHGVAHFVVALVERADLDLLVLILGFARAREARDQHREAADGGDDEKRLQREGGDVQPERHQ